MMVNITSELAEIIGLLCAEGSHVISYSSYWGKDRGRKRYYKNDKSERIEFTNKDVKLLKHYQTLLLKEFKYKTKITKHHKINICKISIIKEIICHTNFGNVKWKVPDSLLKSDNITKISFIRGYFDGDGTVSSRVRMFSVNKKGISQVSNLLNDLNIKHSLQGPIFKKNRKPAYIVQISEKERERFLNLIKPISKKPGILRG